MESAKTASQQQVEHLNEQLARETEAYEHTLERQQLKHTQEKQKFNLQLEALHRERLQYLEKIELTENVLEKQQQLFETKITVLKEKVKICKADNIQVKKMLEHEHSREQQRKQEVDLC